MYDITRTNNNANKNCIVSTKIRASNILHYQIVSKSGQKQIENLIGRCLS